MEMWTCLQEGSGEGTLLLSEGLRGASGSRSKLMLTNEAPDASGCSTVAGS